MNTAYFRKANMAGGGASSRTKQAQLPASRRAVPVSVRGFTLIEMLIVVAIIGLLASTILVGLGSVRRTARDARRTVDLQQIRNGLEIYFAKCRYYPGLEQSGGRCGNFQAPDSFAEMVEAITKSNLDISQIPNDPLYPVATYYYGVLNQPRTMQGRSYLLGAIFEDVNSAALEQDIDNEDVTLANYGGDIQMAPDGCGDRDSDTTYCVKL